MATDVLPASVALNQRDTLCNFVRNAMRVCSYGRRCVFAGRYNGNSNRRHGLLLQVLLQKVTCLTRYNAVTYISYKQGLQLLLECGPMPNVMGALSNIGGAFCTTVRKIAF